jgi:hypothetical protein
MRGGRGAIAALSLLHLFQHGHGFAADDLADAFMGFQVTDDVLLQLFALRGGQSLEFLFRERYGAESSHRRISLQFAPVLMNGKLTSLRA